MERVRKDVMAFFHEHGKRPAERDMQGVQSYLQREHGTSLHEVCNALALPGRRAFGRTIEDAEQEILDYYEAHGRRPTDEGLKPLASWLNRNGYAMWKVCDELGLPGEHQEPVRDRTLAKAKKEIRTFVREHGRRPRVRDKPALNAWLRKNERTTLRVVCLEMGYKD